MLSEEVLMQTVGLWFFEPAVLTVRILAQHSALVFVPITTDPTFVSTMAKDRSFVNMHVTLSVGDAPTERWPASLTEELLRTRKILVTYIDYPAPLVAGGSVP
jgi:hypothetical protein